MQYGAIDLHLRRSQIRIVDEEGHVLVDRRVETTARSLTLVFGVYPPMRILVESATESEWVAQCLEACGHTVIVGDPNYSAMYSTRTRRLNRGEAASWRSHAGSVASRGVAYSSLQPTCEHTDSERSWKLAKRGWWRLLTSRSG